jgi:exopolysaccharide biosynthesis WecB/TagA/CpsF family protein
MTAAGPERDAARAAAPWQARWRQLASTLVPLQDEADLARALAQWTRPARTQVLAFANAHALNLAARDTAFFADLSCADLLARDGQGMAWLLRLLGRPPGLNLNGTDLIPRLITGYAAGLIQAVPARAPCIALLGTREPWLSRAAARVQALAPGARCICADGFQPTVHYLRLLARESPDLVVLGMGMPRQERLARTLQEALRAQTLAPARPCLIVCGGAILDFLGGRFARAPRLLRALGLEWAWRLALEPRRLARRYLAGNPLFLARALRLALALRWARQASAASSSARS